MIYQYYVNQSLNIFENIIQTLRIENAPNRLYFEDSNFQNIAAARNQGNKIFLTVSTPIDLVEDVLIHELSHWILEKHYLINDINMHDEYFLAMQLKMYGGIKNYENSACFILDKQQNGYSKAAYLKAIEIFNNLNSQHLSVDDFAKKLTVFYNNEYKKTFKYKYEFLVQAMVYSAIACFFAYQLI